MAYVQLPDLMLYPRCPLVSSSVPSFTSVSMTTFVTKQCAKLIAPRTGQIAKIGFRVTAVTKSQSLDCRIETLASTGHPSGTLWATNTSGVQASVAANTTYWVTLTANASVTLGDPFHVVLQWTSTTGDVAIRRYFQNANNPHSLFTNSYTSGSWNASKLAGIPSFVVEYSDGYRYNCGGYFADSFTSASYNTGTTPDEFGLYFQVPVPMKCYGVQMYKGLVAGTTYSIKLYDSDGSTVLASKSSIDTDAAATSPLLSWDLFSSAATLVPSTWYRLTFLPGDATSHTGYYIDVDANATLDMWGDRNMYWTQRTDAGAWSETNTRRPMMWPIIGEIDYSVPSGGPLIGGRLLF